ncbi:alanine racemase [Nocardia sp. JMUB6875]|uniref:alanine racemase n=1 Tax=Nocardia sp. JMUB6875 TaxID=3158170 RepID=UPI0034E8719E
MTAVAVPTRDMSTRPELHVDLEAIAANTRLFTARTAGEVMAVVKADGFGHGAADVARTALANGATRLGITSLTEGFALREAGLDAAVLSWLNPVDADWAAARRARIDVAVPSREHLLAIAAAGPGSRVHLHLDTGMARDGAASHEWSELCAIAAGLQSRGEIRVVGVMGHLGCAGTPKHPDTDTGRIRFGWALDVALAAGLDPADQHLAATAATLTDPRTHYTMSRIGAGLVGIDPSRTSTLRPALTLTAPIVTVREVRPGTPVGYDHTWVADRHTTLALLPIGYADGLPRRTSGRAEVQIAGRRCPLVGRISMDMAVIDVGDLSVRAGDIATVFGSGDTGEPTVRDWADWAETIEHEIVTGLGSRLHRTTRGSHR